MPNVSGRAGRDGALLITQLVEHRAHLVSKNNNGAPQASAPRQSRT